METQDLESLHFDLSQDLAMARRVQQGFLDIPTPEVPGIGVAKRCVPAQTIGGDFYVLSSFHETVAKQGTTLPGVVHYSDRRESVLDVVVGDVAGHGVSSALVMALSAGILGEAIRPNRSPALIVAQLNDRLIDCISHSQIRYITAGYARFYPQLGKMMWVRAGHPAAILLRQGQCSALSGDGVFLGMFPGEIFQAQEVTLMPGDRIILYTDGFTEARIPHQDFVGEAAFFGILEATSQLPIAYQLEAVYAHIQTLSGTIVPADDQTLVIVEIH
jgi:serine phosphatase RsbU (regulator of sigma subunit)